MIKFIMGTSRGRQGATSIINELKVAAKKMIDNSDPD